MYRHYYCHYLSIFQPAAVLYDVFQSALLPLLSSPVSAAADTLPHAGLQHFVDCCKQIIVLLKCLILRIVRLDLVSRAEQKACL